MRNLFKKPEQNFYEKYYHKGKNTDFGESSRGGASETSPSGGTSRDAMLSTVASSSYIKRLDKMTPHYRTSNDTVGRVVVSAIVTSSSGTGVSSVVVSGIGVIYDV